MVQRETLSKRSAIEMTYDERQHSHPSGGIDRRTILRVTVAGTAAAVIGAATNSDAATDAQSPVASPQPDTEAPAASPEAGAATPVAGGQQFAYVGSDSRSAIEAGADPAEVGISVFAVDGATGVLSHVQTLQSDNPFYFAFDPTQQFLYAVNVIGDFEGQESGSVEAYARDPQTGMLTFINRQASGG
jgi:hypothetical protein